MASLASTAVAGYPSAVVSASVSRRQWWYPDSNQKSLVTKSFALTLTGQGGATNTIPASALGFSVIYDCSNLWDATNSKGYPAVIDPVNNIIILLDGSAAPAPVDVTSSAAYITVTGSPAALSA